MDRQVNLYADDPPQWLDALKVAVSSDAIANLPLTDGNLTYGGHDPIDWNVLRYILMQ